MNFSIPARHGQSWSRTEDSALYTELSLGTPIEAIARRHKRTERAVECRIEFLEKKLELPFVVKEQLIINGVDYLTKLATSRLRVNACIKDQARWALNEIHRLASSYY